MPRILFVDACPRRGASRTLALARVLLDEFRRLVPDAEIDTHCLADMKLAPVDEKTLAFKEGLCDRRRWDDPYLAPAVTFQQADAVIIAAPYWDMSFPSVLKVWVENMYVRNLTFRYENDRPIGMARGRVCAYVTTAGSPIAEHDWGAAYIRDVMHMLGVGDFIAVKAEALDLSYSDPEAILARARQDAREAAADLARHFA